jgi:streptogrisin C
LKGFVVASSVLLCSVGLAAAGTAERVDAGPAARGKAKVLNLNESAIRIQRAAQRRWPGSFAGLWVDRGRIFVAFTERAKARLRKLGRKLGRTKGKPKPVVFDDSLRELEDLLDRGAADRETGARPISAPYDLSIDQRRNSMVVTVGAVDDRVIENFQLRYGSGVIVEEGVVSGPYACTVPSCYPVLRGGLASVVAAGGTCSTGFVVRHRGSVKNLILSTAHCGDTDAGNPGGLRRHGSPAADYGWVWQEQYAYGVDAEVHRVYGAYDARKPLVYASSQNKSALVYSSAKYSDAFVGQYLCKSGQKTGFSCGSVTNTQYVPNKIPSTPGKYFVRTDMCAQPGDSGGAVYKPFVLRSGKIGFEAHGLLSGGPKNPDGTAPPCGSTGFQTFFSHIDLIDSALPVNVLRVRDLKK